MKTSPRDIKKALLASLLSPGLGQMYNGQLYKAIGIALAYFILTYLFLSVGDNKLENQQIILIAAIVLYVYALYDAMRFAKKYKTNYELKRVNHFFNYFIFIVLKINIRVAIFYTLGFSVYVMPTTANFPTVNAGDKFVLDMSAYNDTEPYYGDLIAFMHKSEYSEVPIVSAYRIVGLPRDRFSIKNNSVVINGKYTPAELVIDGTNYPAMKGLPGSKPYRQSELNFSYSIYKEFYPNDFAHFSAKVITKDFQHPMEDMEAINIPSQHYFLMGDNRDNAIDSRFIGLVKKDQIVGKIKEETITKSTIEAYQLLFFWSSELSDFFNIRSRNYLKL